MLCRFVPSGFFFPFPFALHLLNWSLMYFASNYSVFKAYFQISHVHVFFFFSSHLSLNFSSSSALISYFLPFISLVLFSPVYLDHLRLDACPPGYFFGFRNYKERTEVLESRIITYCVCVKCALPLKC